MTITYINALFAIPVFLSKGLKSLRMIRSVLDFPHLRIRRKEKNEKGRNECIGVPIGAENAWRHNSIWRDVLRAQRMEEVNGLKRMNE